MPFIIILLYTGEDTCTLSNWFPKSCGKNKYKNNNNRDARAARQYIGTYNNIYTIYYI